MFKAIEIENQKQIYLLSSFFILWMGISATFCYEMGKHGLGNIDWSFVFKSNIPVMFISGSLFFQQLKTKK